MQIAQEYTVNTVYASTDGERTAVVVCTNDAGDSHIEVRQQSWGGDRVGWFTQSSIRLAADQLAPMRQALGQAGAMPQMVAESKKERRIAGERPDVFASHLKVWQAESA
ncbi:hypothetical protein [Blastopirellula marina]|uniref:Uncharacterized protein n=1 Tax=Blastopirellula marina DSM 3645 TaxID=314230 RepID=A3ZR37_9BACT|nr:hypothetical protein [Blastopirellula marina]EAQ81130.1 hypothetical protein DSM3645_21202 [Blastopirellula marina DSM 3645]